MTLRLHDTATRSVRDFVPKTPGQVGIYLCGLTVQSTPHIGHLRSGVNYDVLRRWLLHSGYRVTFVRNVTDIDDKILQKSLEQGRPFWSIAYENRLLLDADYRALNVLPPGQSGDLLVLALEKYIAKKGTVSPSVEGRVVISR